jgi:hypothetical protein
VAGAEDRAEREGDCGEREDWARTVQALVATFIHRTCRT